METIFKKLWKDYTQLNSQASTIYALLSERGEDIINDHIALRTFQHPKVGLDVIAKAFTALGYEAMGDYHFSEKKLFAKHYQHPKPEWPKIFISELILTEFSQALKNHVEQFIDEIDDDKPGTIDFLHSGTHWPAISSETYTQLKEESEYAAWMAAFGFRPNHFTVFVNTLNSFQSLTQLNDFLKQKGFLLNASGGEIKGSPQAFLEQSSTMAAPIAVNFSDRNEEIPGCYYEFAYRYPQASGQLYQGFVAQSADKIFESTDNKDKNTGE